MATAYSYVRFSSKKQERGESVKRQTDFAVEFCQRHNHTLDETLNLKDLGVSAFRGANVETGALGAFLEAVKSGRVRKGSILIVESLDRLSRAEVRKALTLFLQLIDAGIKIVTKEGVFDDKSANDTANIVIAIVTMSRANDESARKSDRSLYNWVQKRIKAKKGVIVTSQCPRWLRVEDGKFVFDTKRVTAIRKLFAMRAQGTGPTALVKWLSKEGIAPFKGKSPAWHRSGVEFLLADRRLLGEYQPTQGRGYGNRTPVGEPIADYFPQVIDRNLFDRVQATRRRGTKRGAANVTKNLFAGLMRDARDKTKIVAPVYGRNPKAFLVSTGARAGLPGSEKQTFAYDAFEFGVISFLRELKLEANDSTAIELEGATERLAQVCDKIRTVQERILAVKDCSSLVAVLEKLDGEKRELEASVQTLSDRVRASEKGTVENCNQVLAALQKSPGDVDLRTRVRAQIRALIEEIWILTERTGRSSGVADVQVHFRNGATRRFRIWHGMPKGWKPGTVKPTKLEAVAISVDGLDEDLRNWTKTKSRPSFPKYNAGKRAFVA